ncbi:hypothetical protein [Thermaurantiacus tibetensis]|uniref:hypothetical protein n=1 Tax=Thermaurantiacus tibetensis TaxID=2759035 RepID=UPI00188EEBF2|nr:hypothetical protein [Thermaurantiacus tibetensis]
MIRFCLAGVALAILNAVPALAQEGTYRTRTVLVYGDDPCPKSENPDEIIVCARRPEEERYRIPRELREAERAATIAREDNVAANRAQLASGRDAATGIGSCSTVGPGGATGCTQGIDVLGAFRTAREALRTATEPTDD